MTRGSIVFATAAAAALLALTAGPALAEEAPDVYVVAKPDHPSPADDWEARQEWKYSTEYLFPLSRHWAEWGVQDEDPFWPRVLAYSFVKYPLVYPVSFLLDIGHLPAGAAAGLFGD